MKEIILPEHEDMKGTWICHACGGIMVPCTETNKFHLNETAVRVSGIKAYKCETCGEIVYNSGEAKLIENTLLLNCPGAIKMSRAKMIEFIKEHPFVNITHPLFSNEEYIYLGDDGRVWDEGGHLFEAWHGWPDGIRYRKGGLWEEGWKVK